MVAQDWFSDTKHLGEIPMR